MANALDIFKFALHDELEALERELVQTVQERVLKEGSSFPGEVKKISAAIEIDLDKVQNSALSCRTIRQTEGA